MILLLFYIRSTKNYILIYIVKYLLYFVCKILICKCFALFHYLRHCTNYSHTISGFSNLNGGIPNCEINCKINIDEDCLKSWIRQNWSFTNSLTTSMGPVFDQRWEGKTAK